MCIFSCKNPSYSVPFQLMRVSPIPSPVRFMYPSILGDVTPSSVRFDGRVYVKEGTHTLFDVAIDVGFIVDG